MPFEFQNLEIKDVVLVKPKIFEDSRGFFSEIYKKSEFLKNSIPDDFVQDNCSFSKKGVLRGLHFQKPPYEQAKLVRCLKGKIIDVALDLRKNSPTFKKYVKTVLSDDNNNILYIPKGFAHGFVVLSDFALVEYKASGEYNPLSDGGIVWYDSDIGIDWGIDFEPVISDKDKNLPSFREVFE